MPLAGFICDYDKKKISAEDCFKFCRKWNEIGGSPRCLPIPILRKMAEVRDVQGLTTTQLTSPTYQTMLKMIHDYWVHPFDLWYLYQGTAGHYPLGSQDMPNQLQEERISDDICSGQIDLFDGDTKTLYDYKFVGHYKANLINENSDSAEEYYRQVNRYASLLHGRGFEVKQMIMCAIIRDWRKWEYLQEIQYAGKVRKNGKPYGQPIPPVVQYEVPVIPDNDNWFRMKKDLLEKYLALKDGEPCSSIERWQEDRRCTEYAYCPVRGHCKYYQTTYKE